MSSSEEFLTAMRAEIGRAGSPQPARDPVNVATIHNWCDAMAEANPRYTHPTDPVAPAAMLNVWTMPGLHMGGPTPRDMNEPAVGVYQMLDDANYPGVVATNVDLYFDRPLKPGDVVTSTNSLVEVSEEKTTRLGIGHFVTTEAAYDDQNGERVGSQRFRILRYRPHPKEAAPDGEAEAPPAERPLKPRPRYNQDQAWHWEGLRERELRIQRFTDDGSLVHPPANSNPATQHMEYDWIVASGKATLYSFTVAHYPQVPSFDYPHIVGLVELEEGVRLVSPIVGCTVDQLEVGMPLQLSFVDTADDVTLHQFMPAKAPRAERTLTASEATVGTRLPICPIPLDPLLIVSTAIATRDFQDVHHNRDAAQKVGSKDIFMNILTTAGLVQRWIGDWAGDDVVFHNIKIGLGAPNYPYDIMTMSGAVSGVESGPDGDRITIGYIGRNSLGAHVTGTAEIGLPA